MAIKNWKNKIYWINNWKGNYWENKQGDIIKIDWIQDRDGKNAFVYSVKKIDRSSIGTSRGKKTLIAKGRNSGLILKKAKAYMRTH